MHPAVGFVFADTDANRSPRCPPTEKEQALFYRLTITNIGQVKPDKNAPFVITGKDALWQSTFI
jgi:hypothetical protein